MAVKFSEFTEETVASNITGIVGYVASSNLNIRIAPGALNTSYDLTATDNAANNVPLVLTGSDSTADTVNFVGAGGIQLSSTGNVVTVTSDARVDSFTNANGTYVSATTANTAATGAVTVGTVDLSAIDGVDTSTRFLSKDNVWSIVDSGVTSFTNANGTYVSAGTVNTAADGAVTVGAIDLSAIDGTSDSTTRFLSKDNTWDVPEIGVTSFTNADGTYISAGTVNTAADGAVTIGTVDLSAIDGTSDLTTRFLSKDNTWDVVDRITGSGTANIVPLWTTTTNLGDSVIAQDGANIGIGTTSPASLLHLEAASSPVLTIKDTTANVTLLAYSQDDNAHIGTASNHDFIFDTNSVERMRIQSSGNVGIGTASPGAKLSVFENGSGVLFTRNSGDNGTTGPVIAFTNNSTQSIMFAVGDGLSFKTRAVGSSYLTGSEKMLIATTGQIKFNEYTSAAAFTGTAVASLAVDSSGNIITEAAASTRTKQAHTISNATTGALTLSTTPSPNTTSYVDLYISGVYQVASSYTLSGTTLTLAGGTFFPQGAAVETIALS